MKIIKTAQFERREIAKNLPQKIKNKITSMIHPFTTSYRKDLPKQEILNALQQNGIEMDDHDLQKYHEFMKLPGDMNYPHLECGQRGMSNLFDLVWKTPEGNIPLKNRLSIQWCTLQQNNNISFETNAYIT